MYMFGDVVNVDPPCYTAVTQTLCGQVQVPWNPLCVTLRHCPDASASLDRFTCCVHIQIYVRHFFVYQHVIQYEPWCPENMRCGVKSMDRIFKLVSGKKDAIFGFTARAAGILPHSAWVDHPLTSAYDFMAMDELYKPPLKLCIHCKMESENSPGDWFRSLKGPPLWHQLQLEAFIYLWCWILLCWDYVSSVGDIFQASPLGWWTRWITVRREWPFNPALFMIRWTYWDSSFIVAILWEIQCIEINARVNKWEKAAFKNSPHVHTFVNGVDEQSHV